MITRNTFSEIVDGLRAYYTTHKFAEENETDATFLLDSGYHIDIEEAVFAVLSESLNDCDSIISDWVHGLCIEDEHGIVHFELCSRSGAVRDFTIKNAGELYDYLMIINDPYDNERAAVEACRGEINSRYDLPNISGGDYL